MDTLPINMYAFVCVFVLRLHIMRAELSVVSRLKMCVCVCVWVSCAARFVFGSLHLTFFCAQIRCVAARSIYT